MGNIKTRNYSLDFFKGIACILVVFMHCEFPGKTGILIQCVSRFCVPFFFMVSGYFCYAADKQVDYKKKIIHISKIIISAIAFYSFINIFFYHRYPVITAHALRDYLIFNVPLYIAGQMWFLYALLYDYVLMYLIVKFKLQKTLKIIVPVGICLYILLAQGAHLTGFHVSNKIYRNFLIEGFPLFSLGYLLHMDEGRFTVSSGSLPVIISATTLCCVLERVLMERDFGVNICTFPQVTAVFLYSLINADKYKDSLFTKLGEKYSMYIYMFHPAVWHMLEWVYSVGHFEEFLIMLYIRPLLCAGISVMLSGGYLRMAQSLKGKGNR